MASQLGILDAFYDELKTVLNQSSAVSVADPTDHAGLLKRHDGSTYPYIGIERFGVGDAQSMGIGGPERVVNRTYDGGGNLTQHTKRRRKNLRVEMAGVIDDGDVRSASNLLTEIEDHFVVLLGDTDQLHDDIHRMTNGGRRDVSRPGDGVVGERLRYDVEYNRDRTVDVTAMGSLDIVIEDTDTATDFPVSDYV